MLQSVQKILLSALLSDDPLRILRQEMEKASDLTDEERMWLVGLDSDGLILTGLIVKKLRLQRLTRSQPELARLMEEDPRKFVEICKRYDAAVPPTVYFPSEEGGLFREWKESVRTT